MNIKAIALSAALVSLCTVTTAQTTSPGYDRPAVSREHQHVVYWNDSFDAYDSDMQIAADATSADDLVKKGDRQENENYKKRHQSHKDQNKT
ncbi:MAG: hypothetical protein ACRYFS_19490 [Janthinobacterium lividum]